MTRRRRSARAEPLEPRTLLAAAPNITSISTDGTAWNEGEYHFITGSFTDADANDRRTLIVDWGDGSPSEIATIPGNAHAFNTNRHAYTDDETGVLGQPRRYTITVTVIDSTNQADTETRQVQVKNVAPSLRLPQDFVPALEGLPLTIPSRLTDQGAADTHTFHWRVTRGTFPEEPVTVFESTARDLVFTPPEDGFYDVSLEARDDDGGVSPATTRVRAVNAPPVLSIQGVGQSPEGPYVLGLSAADVTADTIQRWTIDWGDGRVETVDGNPPAALHAYEGPGAYVVRASATDEDGTWGAAPLGVAWRAGGADASFGPPATPGRAFTDFPLPVDTIAADALPYPDGSFLVLRNSWDGNGVEGLALARFKPDGSLDGTFDGDGRLFIPGRFNTGQTLALQRDAQGNDRILFAAVRTQGTFFESYLDVFRLNPDGSRDATFGTGGVATAPIGVEHEGSVRTVNDLLPLPGGKILVPAGGVGLFTGNALVVRFNADGSLDPTFGNAGRAEIAPPPGAATARASEALLSTDGRVILAGGGAASAQGQRYSFLTRIGDDGAVDTAFGNGGWATRSFGLASSTGSASAVNVLDGTIVRVEGFGLGWSLFRYTPSGLPDTSFGGGDGVADFPAANADPHSLAIGAGGTVIVGATTNGSAPGILVSRYNADGTPDATFGNAGQVKLAAAFNPGPATVAAVRGGRTLVVGSDNKSMLAARLNADGTPDATFGSGGTRGENRFGPWSFVASTVRAVHVLPDKKILAIGRDPNGRGNWQFMARYNPDGTPDLTFGEFGRIATTSDYFVGAFDASGRFLVSRAGSLTRLNPDGSTDAGFHVPDASFLNYVGRFAAAPGGKVVGVGSREDRLVVVRLNADGSPDTTFAEGGRFEGFPGFISTWVGVGGLTVQPDGRVVVGANGLVRLTAGGMPDPTFGGGDGFAPPSPIIPPGWEEYGQYNFTFARGLTVAPDGTILTAWGGNSDQSVGGFAVARYLPDGTLDPRFAGDGQGLYGYGIAEQIALDPRGRILVGGFGSDSDAPGAPAFTALRLLPDGSPDLSFGVDAFVGVPTNPRVASDWFFEQMSLTDGGDVILGGLAPDGRFVLSRFHGDDAGALTVSVANRPPVASAGPDVKAIPGRPVTLTGTFTDPSPSDTHTFHWKVTNASGGTEAQGDGPSITFTPPTTQRYTATFTVTDDDGASSSDTAVVDAAPAVVGRWLFYDNSAYDGHAPGPNRADNNAVATDKQPLLPGGGPGAFANVTGYSRGINGVMIDVAGDMPLTALVGVAMNVGLKSGTGGDPAAWPDAPRPTLISVFPGDGAGGSDRIVLTWPDGAIRNAWLRVTVRDVDFNGGFGLPDDTFLFGNLVGDAADRNGLKVDATDLAVTRAAQGRPATVTNVADHNRDGRVNVLDQTIVRGAIGRSLTAVSTPPAAAALPPLPRRRPVGRGVLDTGGGLLA